MDILDTNNLGVNPQEIRGKNFTGYANTLFKIDDKYYLIEQDANNSEKIHKLITLLKNDEFKGSGNDIFTYIIGTEYKINTSNKTLTRYPTSYECDILNMNLWAKPSVTIQEIESKHGIIIDKLRHNHDIIINELQTSGTLDPTLEHDNSIDQLYYAGEMKYDNDTDTLYINFMSGSFMLDVIDSKNPSQKVIDCVKNFFENKLGITNVIIDTSGETYITQPMTIEQLNTYVNYGITAYVFDNERDAFLYSNKKKNLSSLYSQKTMNDRMLSKFPKNESYLKKSEELNSNINRLNSMSATIYVPESSGGRKTRKCRKCGCSIHSRRNKIRRNKKNN